MAVTVQTPIKVSVANGLTSVFPYDFRILDEAHLLVTGTLTGVTTTYVLSVDYTIDGVGSASGGNVTFVNPPANGTIVSRKRNMPYERSKDYQTNGDLIANELDDDQDAPVMMMQQIDEAQGRSLHVGAHLAGTFNTELNPEALMPLVFAADGLGVEAGDTTLTGDMLLRPNLASVAAGRGSDLVAFRDSLAPAYLSTLSDIINGQPLSLFRFISPPQHAAIKAGTSIYDATADVQAAFASGAFQIDAPYGVYRLTDTINMFGGVRLVGAGVHTHTGSIGELNTRGGGTWFNFDHDNVGFNVANTVTPGELGQGALQNFGTFRTRADPTGTLAGAYVPLACDPDIVMTTTDMSVEHVVLLNPTTGIRVDNAGRLYVRYLRGQPILTGIDLVQATDACRIRDVHWWPFWSNNAGVRDYQIKNTKGFRLGRADNPSLSGLFTIGHYMGVECYLAAGGRVSKLRLTDSDFDLGQFAVKVDAAADGAYGLIANVTSQSSVVAGLTDNMAQIDIAAPNSTWDISNVVLGNSRGGHIRASGASCIVNLSNIRVGAWNQSLSSFTALNIGLSSSTMKLDKRPDVSAAGGASTQLFGGAGRYEVADAFSGYFSSDGTTTVKLPVGMTVSRLGAGTYTLNHNLSMPSSTDVIPELTCDLTAAGAFASVDIANSTVNAIRIRTYVGTTLTDCGVFFNLKRRPLGLT